VVEFVSRESVAALMGQRNACIAAVALTDERLASELLERWERIIHGVVRELERREENDAA
jgi:hypothetical protein